MQNNQTFFYFNKKTKQYSNSLFITKEQQAIYQHLFSRLNCILNRVIITSTQFSKTVYIEYYELDAKNSINKKFFNSNFQRIFLKTVQKKFLGWSKVKYYFFSLNSIKLEDSFSRIDEKIAFVCKVNQIVNKRIGANLIAKILKIVLVINSRHKKNLDLVFGNFNLYFTKPDSILQGALFQIKGRLNSSERSQLYQKSFGRVSTKIVNDTKIVTAKQEISLSSGLCIIKVSFFLKDLLLYKK